MTTFLPFLGATVVAGLVGIVAHESAHAGACLLLGREIHAVDWRRLHVDYVLPADGPDWRDYVIGAAPLVLAASAGLTAVVTAVTLSVPGWIGIGVCGLYGGLADLRVTTVDPDTR